MPAKLTRDKLLKLAENEIEYPYGHWNNIESTSQCVIEKKEITDIDLSWKDISWTTFSQCIIKNVNFKNAIVLLNIALLKALIYVLVILKIRL